MSNATEGTIVINTRAQDQLRDLMETAEKINGQINTYAAALAAALDVPEGWQLDVRSMAFVAPQAPDAADDLDAAPDANHVEG